jgi:tRNA(Met) cytidine acetyltransferase
MALQQLRDWLFAPYYTQAVTQKSDVKSKSVRPQIHRRLLVISGESRFVHNTVNLLLADVPSQCLAEEFSECQLKGKNRKVLLGSERDIAILHCQETFSPGNFMALTGTIKHSGCLIVTCPPFDKWPQQRHASFISFGYECNDSAYLKRFIKLLTEDHCIAIHSPDSTRLPNHYDMRYIATEGEVQTLSNIPESAHIPLDQSINESLFKSTEQRVAFDALCEQFEKNNLNTLIAASRGRGKSSLLGIFIWHLLHEGKCILLTSALFENVHSVFRQIDRMCKYDEISEKNNKKVRKNENNHNDSALSVSDKKRKVGEGTVEWVAPDNPKLINGHSDIVFIDEAASFPIPILLNVIKNHRQWLLSTTLQGYEGSGSGFIHKLLPRLDSHLQNTTGQSLNIIELHTPLRWFINDPLENFVNKACLFDPRSENLDSILKRNYLSAPTFEPGQEEPFKHSVSRAPLSEITVSKTTFQGLSEKVLEDVMVLLTLAHYQTTPDDLMRLLDSPDLILFLLHQNAKIIGAAVINVEGGEKLQDIADNIATGERRLKGHLSAQQLSLITANPALAKLNYWRINRIAVSLELQGNGLGTFIVESIKDAADNANIDSLTTSYGSEKKLDRFWEKNTFNCLHKGEKANKASGETSVLRAMPLSEDARMLLPQVRDIYDGKRNYTAFDSLTLSMQLLYLTKLRHFIAGYRSLENVWEEISAIAMCYTNFNIREVSGRTPNAYPTPTYQPTDDSLTVNTLAQEKQDISSIIGAFYFALNEADILKTCEKRSEMVGLMNQCRPHYNSLSHTLETKGRKETTTALKKIISSFISRLDMPN